MKLEQAKKYMERCIKKADLTNWEIELLFSSSITDKGNCDMNIDKLKAVITLNSTLDDEEMKTTIKHEIYHIILSPFSQLVDSMNRFITEYFEKTSEKIEEEVAYKLEQLDF